METPAAPAGDPRSETMNWTLHHTPAARYSCSANTTTEGMFIVKEVKKHSLFAHLLVFSNCSW